jgi:hypothetical protein
VFQRLIRAEAGDHLPVEGRLGGLGEGVGKHCTGTERQKQGAEENFQPGSLKRILIHQNGLLHIQ